MHNPKLRQSSPPFVALKPSVVLRVRDVPCVAWPSAAYKLSQRLNQKIWVPYTAEGVDYSQVYISAYPKGNAFNFAPRMSWTCQMLMMLDISQLPESLDYIGELYGKAEQRPELTWIPFPVNQDLESWFVARDRDLRKSI